MPCGAIASISSIVISSDRRTTMSRPNSSNMPSGYTQMSRSCRSSNTCCFSSCGSEHKKDNDCAFEHSRYPFRSVTCFRGRISQDLFIVKHNCCHFLSFCHKKHDLSTSCRANCKAFPNFFTRMIAFFALLLYDRLLVNISANFASDFSFLKKPSAGE